MALLSRYHDFCFCIYGGRNGLLKGKCTSQKGQVTGLTLSDAVHITFSKGVAGAGLVRSV